MYVCMYSSPFPSISFHAKKKKKRKESNFYELIVKEMKGNLKIEFHIKISKLLF